MNTRLYNARILSMLEEKSPVIANGEVWVEGSRITMAGEPGNAEKPLFDREIDCGGGLLMPGFKDAHTHSAMTFLRSHADDLPLHEWLNIQVFPYEAKLTPEDIYELTRLAVLEYVSGGITAAMEMYLTPESIASACQDTGMRLVQVGGVNNFSQSAEDVERWYNELNGVSELTSFRLGFHAQYTCSPELLEKIAGLSRKYQAPVYTHIAETKSETEECRKNTGMSPVAYLASMGIFDYGGAGYHLIWTDESDRRIMKEKGIAVVTNPGSNTKLASGIAPVADYLRDGITVAIGTDGPASNNCLDMFREMFLTTGLAKLKENDAAAVPAYEVLRMACVNGARVMGLDGCDAVAAGKCADLILIDLDEPNMQPLHNIANNLVYSGSKSNVKMTMIAGEIRYDRFDGRPRYYIGADPAEIYAKSREICDRIFG